QQRGRAADDAAYAKIAFGEGSCGNGGVGHDRPPVTGQYRIKNESVVITPQLTRRSPSYGMDIRRAGTLVPSPSAPPCSHARRGPNFGAIVPHGPHSPPCSSKSGPLVDILANVRRR